MNAFKYTKSELVDFVTEAYQFMKTRGTPIEIIRIDNAGENEKVAKNCKNLLNVEIEHTPPDTPKLIRKWSPVLLSGGKRQRFDTKCLIGR